MGQHFLNIFFLQPSLPTKILEYPFPNRFLRIGNVIWSKKGPVKLKLLLFSIEDTICYNQVKMRV